MGWDTDMGQHRVHPKLVPKAGAPEGGKEGWGRRQRRCLTWRVCGLRIRMGASPRWEEPSLGLSVRCPGGPWPRGSCPGTGAERQRLHRARISARSAAAALPG